MSTQKMKAEDVQTFARATGIDIKAANAGTIASTLSQIRQSVSTKASALPQDAPLAVYFDAC